MPRPPRPASRPATTGPTARQHALIGLVGRLLIAQAGASAAIGISYSRRSTHSIVVTIVAAIAICGLAAVVRSGSQPAWLLAISVEATFVAVGLFSFAYARYLGGTLLALITLGTLLHPKVARAFAPSALRRPVRDHSGLARPGLADSAADVLPGQAVG